MGQGIPVRVNVDGRKISELVFKTILPSLDGQPIDVVVMSLLSGAVLAMRPNCPVPKLQQVVMDTSSYLIMQLQEDTLAVDAN